MTRQLIIPCHIEHCDWWQNLEVEDDQQGLSREVLYSKTEEFFVHAKDSHPTLSGESIEDIQDRFDCLLRPL